MRKALLVALACAVLFAASPALAQGSGGFFVALENKFLKPSNLGNEFAIVDDELDGTVDGKLRSVEFDNEYAPKLWIGQSFGDSGWAVSYWSFDEEARELFEPTGFDGFWTTALAPTFDSFFQGFENDFGTAEALSTVEARTADLIYWHKAAETGRLRLSWYGGLRHASFEEMLDIAYSDGFDTETALLTSEMDGIGFTGGLNGAIRIGESWFVYGSLGYSYLMSDVEASNSQVFVFSELDVMKEDERAVSILDLSCSIGWWVSENFQLRLGYELSNWANASDRLEFADDVNPARVITNTRDVSWDGFNLGIGVRF